MVGGDKITVCKIFSHIKDDSLFKYSKIFLNPRVSGHCKATPQKLI